MLVKQLNNVDIKLLKIFVKNLWGNFQKSATSKDWEGDDYDIKIDLLQYLKFYKEELLFIINIKKWSQNSNSRVVLYPLILKQT